MSARLHSLFVEKPDLRHILSINMSSFSEKTTCAEHPPGRSEAVSGVLAAGEGQRSGSYGPLNHGLSANIEATESSPLY